MTEQNYFKVKMNEHGHSADECDELIRETKNRLHMFTFTKGSKENQLISKYNGIRVFIYFGHEDRVGLGETWVCSTETINNYYYATPIMKVTPGFLINLDSNLRDNILSELWLKHRDMFENQFAEKYKQEILDSVSKDMDSEYKVKINQLQDRINELEAMNQHNNYIISNSYMIEDEGIELGSFVDEGGTELCTADNNGKTMAERRFSHTIPSMRCRTEPGFPEMNSRYPTQNEETSKHETYVVERTGEDTIYSDSFRELKYFVHITPSLDKLVIRPYEYGNAISINRTITLKGLGKISQFEEKKQLRAEYSKKYGGVMVYL